MEQPRGSTARGRKQNQAITVNRIEEPTAVDSRHKLKDAFQNEQGFVYYLFDAEGKLKTRASGEYGVDCIADGGR